MAPRKTSTTKTTAEPKPLSQAQLEKLIKELNVREAAIKGREDDIEVKITNVSEQAAKIADRLLEAQRKEEELGFAQDAHKANVADLAKREKAVEALAKKIADQAGKKTDVGEQPLSGQRITISSTQANGHYRAGVHHPKAGHTLFASEFTQKQLDALDADTQLTVEVLKEDADPK